MKRNFTRTFLAATMLTAASLTGFAVDGANPYAYDIKVNSANKARPTVTFKLNAPASKVEVKALINGTVVNSQVIDNAAAGSHSSTLNLEGRSGKVTFEIAASRASAASQWTPVSLGSINLADQTDNGYGISLTVNRYPESSTFGQIVVSETGGSSIGLRVFNPDFTDTGRKGINPGINSSDVGSYAGLVQRVRFSDDGRLFALSNKFGSNGLYELNPETLAGSPVFQGTTNTTNGYVTDGSGNFVGGCGAGLDVWGSGNNLKVAVVSTRAHVASASIQRLSVYNLGTAKTWNSAPTATSADTWNQKTNLLYGFTNAPFAQCAFDKDGKGVGALNFVGTPTDDARNYIHTATDNFGINFNALTDFSYITENKYLYNWYYASAMAYNADYSMLAVAVGNVIRFYSVEVSNGGKPTFTHKFGLSFSNLFTSAATAHIDDIAFDYAGNLYMVSNADKKVHIISTYNPNTTVTTPAPASASYDLSNTPAPEYKDGSCKFLDVKTYLGRNMVSLKWTSTYNSAGNPPLYYSLFRDGQEVAREFDGTSFIDTAVPDGTHSYVLYAYYKSGENNGGSLYYVKSDVRDLPNRIARDPAMTSYVLKEVYNYPIQTQDEVNANGLNANNCVIASGITANMRARHGAAGAPGDMYRQGVFYKGKWYIAQVTDRMPTIHSGSSTPYIFAYDAITSGETGGVVTFDGNNPRTGATRYSSYSPMVNQSIALFDDSGNIILRANKNLGGVNGAGTRYLDITASLAQVYNSEPHGQVERPLPDGFDFPSIASNRGNHDPQESAAQAQYYRNQYFNSDGSQWNGRLFVPMNMSRDLYVIGFYHNVADATRSRLYTAPATSRAGTENYAVPINGRQDFLHIMRSDAIYYVNAETGEYTLLTDHPSEVRSAAGATFVFDDEIFFIHPTSNNSNNPGHFRIDMPSRQWDPNTRKFITDYKQADFTNMVPIASYVQPELAGFEAGNSNGTFFGFEDGTDDEWGVPCKYIYQYVPGVRFAKYKLVPMNQFPPVQPGISVDLVTKHKDGKEELGGGNGSYEDMHRYVVNYGWSPYDFEQVQGTNYVTDHYVVELMDENGNVVHSYTEPYDKNKSYYNAPTYYGSDNNGVRRDAQYTVKVTTYYRNTTSGKMVEGEPGYASASNGYKPGIRPLEAKGYKDEKNGVYRVDLNFDPAPKTPEQAQPGETPVPEPVSYFYFEYSKDGGNTWEPVPGLNMHVGDKNYDPKDHGHRVPGDYDFNNDKTPSNTINDGHGNQVPDGDNVVAHHVTTENPEGYKYRVTAVYAEDNNVIRDTASSEAQPGTFTPTGVEDIVANGNTAVHVYPVPAAENVTVLSDSPIAVVKIYSLAGALIKDVHCNGIDTMTTIDIANLGRGVYLLTVNDSHPVRIVKN